MPISDDGRPRCPWGYRDELMLRYHDEEWGTPLHDERKHFEFLLLESMQAGLSWSTVLRKRENFRAAFDGFDPSRIARYGERKIASLLEDAGIIRNRLKIGAAIGNARAFLETQAEFGSFDAYLWSFTEGRSVVNRWTELGQIPVSTPLSDLLSRDLVARGFRFVGTKIVYAHLQAIGVVNDHLVSCFRRAPVPGADP